MIIVERNIDWGEDRIYPMFMTHKVLPRTVPTDGFLPDAPSLHVMRI